jgi:hypothetical protein
MKLKCEKVQSLRTNMPGGNIVNRNSHFVIFVTIQPYLINHPCPSKGGEFNSPPLEGVEVVKK